MKRRPTKEMLEDIEIIPHYALGDALNELLFWEACGFGNWKVADVADFLFDYIKEKRESERK